MMNGLNQCQVSILNILNLKQHIHYRRDHFKSLHWLKRRPLILLSLYIEQESLNQHNMHNIYLWIVTAILNILGILTIKSSNDMFVEEPFLENKLVISYIREEYMAFSLIYCSAVCLQYTFCECFGFNPMIQACRVHAYCLRNSTFVNNAGWKYYKRGMCIQFYFSSSITLFSHLF